MAKKEPKFRVEKINFVWSKAEIELADEPARLNKLQVLLFYYRYFLVTSLILYLILYLYFQKF